MTHKLEKY